MKKKEILDDLEIYIDPKPLTKKEELALSLFIRKLKEKNTRPTLHSKKNFRNKPVQI